MLSIDKCPKCGYSSDITFEECPKCGIIVIKCIKAQKRKEEQKRQEEYEKKAKKNTSGWFKNKFSKKVFVIFGAFVLILLLYRYGGMNSGEDKPSKDITGWIGTKWGMTEREIENKLKDDVERIPRQPIETEFGYSNLVIKRRLMCNGLFQVYFGMSKTTQRLISISASTFEDITNRNSRKVFLCMESELTDLFGFSPSENNRNRICGFSPSENNRNSISRKMSERYWQFPSTIIRLSFFEIVKSSESNQSFVTLLFRSNNFS